jgi:hypothetical protein
MVAELRRKNYMLQQELDKANKHIEFLTSLTAQKLQTFGNPMARIEPTQADMKDYGNPIPEEEKKVEVHTVVSQPMLEGKV